MSSFVMAMKELERGRELAHQLRRFMFSSAHEEDDDGVKGKKALTTSSAAAEDLASKVLDSFTNVLSLFNNPPADSSSPSSLCNLPASSDESHQSPKRRRRAPTSSSIKHPTTSSPKKSGRKIMETTWEEESKISPKEDGHAWRKYGQKYILNSKHPRNYFRCTHKYEQGCEATKQVQKIQDDPPLYKTTYFGHHTCTNFLNPHMFVDDSHDYDYLNSTSAFILSFDNNHSSTTTFDQKLKTQQNHLFLSSSSSSLFPSSGPAKYQDNHCDNNVKKDNNIINHINDNIKVVVPSCASNDYLVSADYEEEAVVPFEYGGGGDDQLTMDVFNSSLFDDPLVFEDYSLFEMI